jgi:hypothetical protein
MQIKLHNFQCVNLGSNTFLATQTIDSGPAGIGGPIETGRVSL